MKDPFFGCPPLISKRDLMELSRTSWSGEKALRDKCMEAHKFYLDLSKGKDELGRMEAMKRASEVYGLNFRSIYHGRPIIDF